MSLFSDDLSDIMSAIDHFNSLTPQEKASLVADLGSVKLS